MSYRINLGAWSGIFAVPNSVVDKYIKLSSEAQIKALLYLLRHNDSAVSSTQLAEALKISGEEADNAVNFWLERGLIVRSGSELIPQQTADIPDANSSGTFAERKKEEKKPRTIISRAHRPDPLFVSKILQEDKMLSGLMQNIQADLNKPLSPGDVSTVVMLYTTFGLPCEVIAILVGYLSTVGDANMRSIERMGIKWSDEGINTFDKANEETDRLKKSHDAWGTVSSLMGIRNVGKPTKSQTEHAYRWLYTWGFNDEMITEAYERCVNTKGEYNIRYINAILQKWHERGINSLDALNEAEAVSPRKTSTKKTQHAKGSVFSVEGASFDVKKYENKSLFDDQEK